MLSTLLLDKSRIPATLILDLPIEMFTVWLHFSDWNIINKDNLEFASEIYYRIRRWKLLILTFSGARLIKFIILT